MMNPEAIRDKVSVVGVGCCQFGENWDKSREDLMVDAVWEAYADAGIEDPDKEIDAVFCGAVYPREGSGEVAESLKLFLCMWVATEVLDGNWKPPKGFEGESEYAYVHIEPEPAEA